MLLLFPQVRLEPGEELAVKGRVDHLVVADDALPVLAEGQEDGVLVRPLEAVAKRRVGARAGVDDRFALGRVVHDFVDVQLLGGRGGVLG